MLVSYEWLKEFIDLDESPERLSSILTMLGLEVEGVTDYGKKYDNFFVGEVLEKKEHPNADRLSLCKVNYGDGVSEAVCGAPNVAKGQKIVFAAPGAFIPDWGAELKPVKIRGVQSNGMICSQAELGLGYESSGIWVLPDDSEVGVPIKDYFKLNDIVYDIDLTPNKADCLSHLGVARDLAVYLKKDLKSPSVDIKEGEREVEKDIEVIIEDSEKCPRYTARVVRGVEVKESPDWLKRRLTSVGIRPMNAVVDVTNYVMMELGQPLHTFDLDNIAGNKIICKTARKGEKFTTLDGKERELDESTLMICDAEKSVAVGGVMGGENSEITEKSKNILLESAYFKPESIRKTSKKLQIQSDSSYRFERGVDIENVPKALDRAAQMIAELAGGETDKGHIDEYPNLMKRGTLKFRFQRARDLIGMDISNETMRDILKRLGFAALEESENEALYEIPPWRADVSSEVDLIEEIARICDYDNIEADYSITADVGMAIPEELSAPELRKSISNFFINNGFSEILTQNIIDPESAETFEKKYIEIANPLGRELSAMRTSLIPSALRTVERNIRLGVADLRLFEIGKTFHLVGEKEKTFIKNHLEKEELIAVLSGARFPKQWSHKEEEVDFFDIKGIIESFIEFFGLKRVEFVENKNGDAVFSKNSLAVKFGDKTIGYIGEIEKKLLKKFDIEKSVFIANIELKDLYQAESKYGKYIPIAPYPAIERDLAFVADKKTPARSIEKAIIEKGGELLKSVEIFDVYEGEPIREGKKSIAFSLKFSSAERTLKDKEADNIVNGMVAFITKKFAADLREF